MNEKLKKQFEKETHSIEPRFINYDIPPKFEDYRLDMYNYQQLYYTWIEYKLLHASINNEEIDDIIEKVSFTSIHSDSHIAFAKTRGDVYLKIIKWLQKLKIR